MLTTLERARFQKLCDREDGGEILSKQEAAEVARLVQQLEDTEAALLAPATERLRQRNIAHQAEGLNRLSRLEQQIERLEIEVEQLRQQ